MKDNFVKFQEIFNPLRIVLSHWLTTENDHVKQLTDIR